MGHGSVRTVETSSIQNRNVTFFEVEEDSYDHAYGHKGGNVTHSISGKKYASVYHANQNEKIDAISIETMKHLTGNIQIYLNPPVDNPSGGTPLLPEPQEFRLETAGMQRIELDVEPRIRKGDSFSIVITRTDDGSILISRTRSDNQEETMEHTNYLYGTDWRETFSMNGTTYSLGDFGIRAYTKDVHYVVDQMEYRLNSEQPEKQIACTFYDCEDEVTYESLDPSIVKVDQTGKMSASEMVHDRTTKVRITC